MENGLTFIQIDSSTLSIGPSPMMNNNRKQSNWDLPQGVNVGSESALILAGQCDELKSPTILFVRSAQNSKMCMRNSNSVRIPLRFLIIILGPKDKDFGKLFNF